MVGSAMGEQAQISTNMLRAACNYPNLPAAYQAQGKQLCHSHFRGFFDYHNALTVLNRPASLFCLPPSGIRLGMVRAFFMREANSMSEDEQAETPAGFTLINAMRAHFPCN
jgi:hypothetical protein